MRPEVVTIAARAQGRRVPGEPGLWMLVMGDLAVFAAFFGVWAWHRATQPDLFDTSREHVNSFIGLANTLILITSSMTVARGLEYFRARQRRRAARSYLAAAGLGSTFVMLKAIEYRELVVAGITPLRNDVFMYYFVFTGIHLLHVLVGLAGLAILISRCRRPRPSIALFEGVGVYWHMVDILWMILFYLIYLA